MAGTYSEGCLGPVAGLRVVDFSRGYPGALTTMLLADYGADVVKVVGREGGPTRDGARVSSVEQGEAERGFGLEVGGGS